MRFDAPLLMRSGKLLVSNCSQRLDLGYSTVEKYDNITGKNRIAIEGRFWHIFRALSTKTM